MISKSSVKFTSKVNCVQCKDAFVIIFFRTMCNKAIMSFGFCDVKNNQDLVLADNTYLDHDNS